MKKTLSLLITSVLSTLLSFANHPDSAYVVSLRSGNALRMAYSTDKLTWNNVGYNYNLLQSDYGAWGAEKKMASLPSVIHGDDGQWYAVWALNGKVNQFATTHTAELSCWAPQDYPYTSTTEENVMSPILEKKGNIFLVTYTTSKGNAYRVTSSDFIHWSKAAKVEVSEYDRLFAARHTTTSLGESVSLNRISWTELYNLLIKAKAAAYNAMQDTKGMGDDSRIFANLKDVKATIKADLSKSKAISPNLIGIFFEDINYAADGGLYAELLQNRDFEYNAKDKKEWNAKSAWSIKHKGSETKESGIDWTIANESPIHKNNPNYSRLSTHTVGSALVNTGYDGIYVKKGEKYDFSVFLRTKEKSKQRVRISLMHDSSIIASTVLSINSGNWKQYKAVLSPDTDCDKAYLAIEPLNTGIIDIDFASLFPQKTFKNRKNGLRNDLAQTLADMHPRFVRFPGGCASHGNGIDNIYHWQATVGPLWERQYDWNIWHYHQSRGLGFHEYFQFCEDIGAEPLPVLAAGVPCQNSSVGGNGQQGGIPWERELKAMADAQGKSIDEVAPYIYNGKPLTMESYLQELLDLIEWANGDAKTSNLAKIRANAGHKAPWNLKYLGIGNEDLISEVFKDRYTWLIKEIKKAHPEITIVGTVGPFWEGSDYEYGWDIARTENIEIVDEHYYNNIGWYLNHQDFYDKYDRNGTKVYLGEWASKGNRWENALAEAIHITNVERNADVVVMSSYAPLLAREGNTQWNPDLIYFNNKEVKPTPNYYIQMLAGQNSGVEYIPSFINTSDPITNDRIKTSVVKDSKGDIIIKLINALPNKSNISIMLDNLSEGYNRITMQQINAERDAKSVSLGETKEINIEELNHLQLPAYSFSIIRLTQH